MSSLIDLESLHFREFCRAYALCIAFQHALGGDFGFARNYDDSAWRNGLKCRCWDARNPGGRAPNYEMPVQQIRPDVSKGTQCIDQTVLICRDTYHLLVEADITILVASDQLARGVVGDSEQTCTFRAERTLPDTMDSRHEHTVTSRCCAHRVCGQMPIPRI